MAQKQDARERELAVGRIAIVLIMSCLALIVFWFRRRAKVNQWFSGFIAVVAFGQIATLIDPKPFHGVRDGIVLYELVARFCSAVSFWFAPYFLLLIGLEMAQLVKPDQQRLIQKWMLIPPVIFGFIFDLFIDPKNGFLFVYLDFSKHFISLSVWGSVCTLLAIIMLIYATVTEKQPEAKLQKFLILWLILPTLPVAYRAYVLPLQGLNDFGDWVGGFGVFVSVLFIIFAIKYGIMGMKITIEKENFDSTMKAITSGTQIMNHALKNKLQVIDLAVANLKCAKVSPERQKELLNIIINSSHQMRGIINSIRQKTAELILDVQPNDLAAIVTETLDCLKPVVEDQQIDLIYHVELVTTRCDKTHIQEVVSNLIQNAIEAMPKGGKLECRLFRLNQWGVIEIQDNGQGIPAEHIEKIYEPFFTTKKTEENFGLGLSYCYNVIAKHQGKLTIKSRNGCGTTAVILLPLEERK
ncbi:MAG TPA: HAMP domain-containing sensor histidine kinase [Bacillota bacterium]|nr:HAMP domain-containing sensor histidine kinase [Bacillota bacterium]